MATTQQAKDEARNLVEEAKSSTKDVARDARQQLRTQADEQTARVAESMHRVASQLQDMGRSGGEGLAADLVRDASGRVEGIASRLDREGLESMLADAKRFARNRPGTFLLAAAAAGALAARLVKATDTHHIAEVVKDAQGGDDQGSGQGLGEDRPELFGQQAAGSTTLDQSPVLVPSSGTTDPTSSLGPR
jgi:hypothetical protein